jgi:lysozyme
MKNPVIGIDISHYQGEFNFVQAAAEGNKFCFVKATEGTHYVDYQFKRNWAEGPRNGLLVGAYHFFRPEEDPLTQAQHFMSVVGPSRIGDLPCVLDLEARGHVRLSQLMAGVKQWLEFVHEQTGKLPLIYTGPSFVKELGDLSSLSIYPLWIAHYHVVTPKVPKYWPRYTFWQYDIKNGVDRDVFNGSLQDLRTLAGIS